MVNYYLVLEKRLGDFNIIDINKLDIIDRFYTNTINDIDLFTLNYLEKEILESVKRNNLVNNDYLNGKLYIISDKHHHLEVLTKDKYSIIKEFQNSDKIIDINLKNKLYGAYKKIADKNFKDEEFKKEILNKFNNSLKSSNKIEIFTWLENLPYENVRDFYFTIYKELK